MPAATATSPTQPSSPTLTATPGTAVPDLNRTPYPAIQQRLEDTRDQGAFPGETVVLPTADWRERVSESELTDSTEEFVQITQFSTSYVVGFEVAHTETGDYLRLDSVDQRPDEVHIAYSTVGVRSSLQAIRPRVMFVRLPKPESVPSTVTPEQVCDQDTLDGDCEN